MTSLEILQICPALAPLNVLITLSLWNIPGQLETTIPFNKPYSLSQRLHIHKIEHRANEYYFFTQSEKMFVNQVIKRFIASQPPHEPYVKLNIEDSVQGNSRKIQACGIMTNKGMHSIGHGIWTISTLFLNLSQSLP